MRISFSKIIINQLNSWKQGFSLFLGFVFSQINNLDLLFLTNYFNFLEKTWCIYKKYIPD